MAMFPMRCKPSATRGWTSRLFHRPPGRSADQCTRNLNTDNLTALAQHRTRLFEIAGMKVSVAILEQRIRATAEWRDALIAKRASSDGTDKSIDDLIADADAYIQSLQRMIDSINRSLEK